MNTIFYLNAPIGDIINFSCFLKDYHESFKNENLYVLTSPNFLDIFKNNVFVKIYDENICYDKIFNYELSEFDSSSYGKTKLENIKRENYSLQDTPYLYFKHVYKLEIPHNNFIPCINLDDYQKSKIESDKPICLINNVSQFFGFDCRFWGNKNYQDVVNLLNNKINFISVGTTNYNTLSYKPIENVFMDLVNKTSLYELLHYIYNAEFILTHESGMYHLANIISDKPRHVIVPAGSRQTYKMNSYKTDNVFVHWIKNDDKSLYQKHCFNVNENGCMNACLIKEINDIFVSNDFCKIPVLKNNEFLSSCMSKISVKKIIQEFEEILN